MIREKSPAAKFKSSLSTLGVTGLVLFSVLPLLWTAYTSLRDKNEILLNSTKISLSGLKLEAYIQVWQDTSFPTLLRNSLIAVSLTMVMSLSLGTAAGYALSRSKFRGRQYVALTYLTVRLLPGVLLLIPIYLLMFRIGLLDTHIGLALAYTTFTLPAAVWLMKGFFDALPPDLENAARVDGCSRLGAMRRISLPLVLPGLAATATLVAIEAWNDVIFALMLTSSEKARTWPVGMREMIGEFQLPWNQLTATAILSLIPVVIGFSLVGTKMIAGITAGAIKE